VFRRSHDETHFTSCAGHCAFAAIRYIRPKELTFFKSVVEFRQIKFVQVIAEIDDGSFRNENEVICQHLSEAAEIYGGCPFTQWSNPAQQFGQE